MTEHVIESFDILLRDKLAELDADETPPALVMDDDPVERLRLDARDSIRAELQGPMPRGGHQVYITPPAPPAAEPGRRHLNILR
jgi:hypothetical protein